MGRRGSLGLLLKVEFDSEARQGHSVFFSLIISVSLYLPSPPPLPCVLAASVYLFPIFSCLSSLPICLFPASVSLFLFLSLITFPYSHVCLISVSLLS